MKLVAVATAFVAVTVTLSHAHECTTSDFSVSATEINARITNVETSCGSTFSSQYSTGRIAVSRDEFCVKTACLSAIDAVSKIYPDCEIQGTNYHDAVQQKNAYIQSECAKFLGGSSAATSSCSSTVALAVAGLVVIVHTL